MSITLRIISSIIGTFFLFIHLQAQNINYWQDTRGLFPILAYNYPDGVPISANTFRVMRNGGINVFINANKGWYPDPKNFIPAFQQLNDINFKWLVIVENECKDDFIYNNQNNRTNKHISKYLDEFNYDFIYGWYIWDEPGANKKHCSFLNLFPNNDFKDINSMVKQIRNNYRYSNKLDYINLFPSYWENFKSQNDYEQYIDDFFSSQEFKPRVLSADFYPLRKITAGGFRNDYFQNLEDLRKKSIQYNTPLWMIILSSGHLSYVQPTFEQIRMQVFCALAYGAKGICYYLYSKSMQSEGYTSWILEKNFDQLGLPDDQYGSRYPMVKNLNKEVQVLGKYLLQLTCILVYHSNRYPNNQKGIDLHVLSKANNTYNIFKSITEKKNNSIKNNAIISLFSDRNSRSNNIDYIMVVNKDTTYERTYKIFLNRAVSIIKIDKNTGKEILIGNNINSFEDTLGGGEGDLFRIKYLKNK